MRRLLTITYIVIAFLFVSLQAPAQQWSKEKAAQWGKENPWFCGVNHTPAMGTPSKDATLYWCVAT